MDFKELEQKVIFWGAKRGIIRKDNIHKQTLKFFSEAGELADAILEQDRVKTKDGFGDVLVTLIINSYQLDFDLTECLEAAYNEIKDREGKTVDGVFIKD